MRGGGGDQKMGGEEDIAKRLFACSTSKGRHGLLVPSNAAWLICFGTTKKLRSSSEFHVKMRQTVADFGFGRGVPGSVIGQF